MKFGKLFLCTLAAASLFVGCKEKEENLGAPSLELSESSIAFEESSAASKVITVTASRDWKAECAETWISVGPESGSASADPQNVTISVIANEGAARTATVTFTIGTVQKNLTVTQKGQPVIDGSSILEETFASSFGSFTPDNTKVWTIDSEYKYAKCTAYNVDGAPSESWLVSSVIDLTGEGAATLSFEHAGKFFASVDAFKENVTVWVKVDGSDNWEQVVVPVYPDNSSWTFVASGDVDLSKYLGSKIQIGFKYTVGTKAGTWEIKNLKIVRSTAKKTLKVSTGDFAVNSDASDQTFDIVSNTSWTVSSDNAEFTVSPASGEGNGTVTISITENTGEDRKAVITVSGTDADPVSFTVTQLKKTDTGNTEYLIISEYVEGGSMEKYIELYNPTANEVDLSSYTVSMYNYNSKNEKGETFSYQLSGTISAGAVLVLKNSQATLFQGSALTNVEIDKVCNFNGNDPIALLYNGTVVDMFGPENVSGDFAKDKTFRRKSSSKTPSATWVEGDWDQFSKDTVDGLGTHTVE